LTSRNPDQGKIGLPTNQILDFAKKLGQLSAYQEQKSAFLEYLKEQFDLEGFIFVDGLPKSFITSQSEDDPPFNRYSAGPNSETRQVNYHLFEYQSEFWVVIPLAFGERKFGNVYLNQKSPFDPNILENIVDLVEISSPAFFASIKTHQQDWRQKQLALVRSVSEQISQITDLDSLTNTITKLVQQTFNYYYVAVFLIGREDGRLHFKASALGDEEDNQGLKKPDFENKEHPGFSIGEHMIGYVAETGNALIANDVSKEPRHKHTDALPNTAAEAVFPLKIENHVIGVFDIQSDNPGAFDNNDLTILRALANNISIAIWNTRLYHNIRLRAEQLSTISEVSRAITIIFNTDELLKKIVNLINERFNYPYVHIFTIDTLQNKIKFRSGSGQRSEWYEQEDIAYDLQSEKGVLSWVAQNQETKRIGDVNSEHLYIKPAIAEHPKGSEMAIPILFGGDVLGILDIQSDQNHAFTMDDQRLMETLADNIAIAIRNARLYHSERWRRQVAESMRDIVGLLSENIALDDILQETLERLQKILPCDIAGIWLFEDELSEGETITSDELVLASYQTSEDYPPYQLNEFSFLPDEWVRNALSNAFPTIRKPDETQGPIAKAYNLPQNYSSIAAPLSTGEEVLGMLTLDHHLPGKYGLESQKITSAFANYAAIAIKNARLYASSQEQAWIATILLQVATATQSQRDLDELVATIVRLTPMIVGIKGCALLLKEPEGEKFYLQASYNIGESGNELVLDRPIPLNNAPIIEELKLTKEPLRVRDPQVDFNLSEPYINPMNEDSLILLPLMTRDEMLGAFLVAIEEEENHHPAEAFVISNERYKIIQGIIQQTAVAIENIRLIEAKQEEAYVSTVLLQSAQTAVSSADIDDTLDSIVHIMPILVGIDASVIYLWDEQNKKFSVTQAALKGNTPEEKLLGTEYSPDDFPMLEAVFENNRPIVYPFFENILPAEDWDLALPDEGQIDPYTILTTPYPLLMGFPLSMKDDCFGVLLALDSNIATNRERRFELLLGMSQQASLAIQNDIINQEMIERERLEREFQLAREIQQTFLPNQMPELENWDMDVHWQTARQVGGDFYDYFLLPDSRLAFVIADVSDKGLAASLYMTVTRTLLRAAALESDSPSDTLEHVNELLLVNSQNGLFVTTFYGILDLDDGRLTYTIAGHNPPMLIRHDQNEVVELEKGGIALGALPNINLPQSEIILKPGDCLVLYTDGVSEAFNDQEQMYGTDRLKKVLKRVIGQDAHRILEELIHDLEDFRGDAPLSDDTTVLALYRILE
jgi:serine phosphatase RsbU (regulator of sigma subunit)/putative methionine-R-sulfoxide reductase with GAF domain